MAKTNYTAVVEQLKQISEPNRDSAFPNIEVCKVITNSELPEPIKAAATRAARKEANPSGYHYESSGKQAAIQSILRGDTYVEPEPVDVSKACIGKTLNDLWFAFYVVTGNPEDTKVEFGDAFVYGKKIDKPESYDLWISELSGMIEQIEAANDDNLNPEPPKSLTASQLTQLVENGRIFGVTFIKRTTGELRTLSCRLGVKKFLRGGKMAYKPAERQLLTVFSMGDKGYRTIPIEGIQRVCVGGQTFTMAGV